MRFSGCDFVQETCTQLLLFVISVTVMANVILRFGDLPTFAASACSIRPGQHARSAFFQEAVVKFHPF